MASYYSNANKSRWGVRYWLPRERATGKRKQKRSGLRFPTKRAAESWYAEERIRLDRLQGVSVEDMTLADYADTWFRAHSAKIRDATAFGYRRMLEHYILPGLGAQLLDRVHATTIEAWHADLASQGLGPSTIHRAHGLLCQILRHAERRGIIRQNTAAICWPAQEKGRQNEVVWEPEHIQRFLNATTEADDLIFRLALMTGIRIGEALALEWNDLDMKDGRLSVRRTQTRDANGAWTFGPPKTARARRTLALPNTLVTELRRHRQRQSAARLRYPGWWDHDLVFCYDDGRSYPRNTLNARLARRCRDIGVPVISMHKLRRAATTWLVWLDAHPRVMQARLGHEAVDMTMYYAHSADEFDRRLAEQIDAAIRRDHIG